MFDLGAPVLIADRLTGECKRRIYESVCNECVMIYLNSYFHYKMGEKRGARSRKAKPYSVLTINLLDVKRQVLWHSSCITDGSPTACIAVYSYSFHLITDVTVP